MTDRGMLESLLVWARLLAGVAAAIWGGLAPLVQVLIVFMVIDVVTGLLAGYITKSLSSEVSLRGMARKAMVLLGVGAASILGPQAGMQVLDDAVAGFFIMHEGLSIAENYTRAGLPFPGFLRDAFLKVASERAPIPPTPPPAIQEP